MVVRQVCTVLTFCRKAPKQVQVIKAGGNADKKAGSLMPVLERRKAGCTSDGILIQ